MPFTFKTACIAGVSLVAVRYLWKYLGNDDKKQNQVIYFPRERDELYYIERERDALFCELERSKPNNVVYGFAALLRVEERMRCQIKYITLALAHLPKFSSSYDKLQEKLKRLQALDGEISQVKSQYDRDYQVSDKFSDYRNEELKVLQKLKNKSSTSGSCPLEEILNHPPLQSTFWNNGSASQSKKLGKEYAKLKKKYPGVSETQIRASMVYAYNHFKRDIFSVGSKRLESMVRRLCVEDEEDSSDDAEEPELCSICLEEMNDNEVVTLSCNHLYHRRCINPWLRENPRCPICRSSVRTSLTGS